MCTDKNIGIFQQSERVVVVFLFFRMRYLVISNQFQTSRGQRPASTLQEVTVQRPASTLQEVTVQRPYFKRSPSSVQRPPSRPPSDLTVQLSKEVSVQRPALEKRSPSSVQRPPTTRTALDAELSVQRPAWSDTGNFQ